MINAVFNRLPNRTFRPLPLVLTLVIGVSFAAAQPTQEQRIELAATHMLRMQLDSGLFVYEHDFVSGADTAADNIVRQAGAGWQLGGEFGPPLVVIVVVVPLALVVVPEPGPALVEVITDDGVVGWGVVRVVGLTGSAVGRVVFGEGVAEEPGGAAPEQGEDE